VANGAQVLAARATDAAGRTGGTQITVNVSNAGGTASSATDTLQLSITQPTSGAAVSGTTWVVLWLGGTTSGSNTYVVTLGGVELARQTTSSLGPVSLPIDTTKVANGAQVLAARATDAAGRTGGTQITVNVSNAVSTATTTTTSTASATPTSTATPLRLSITQPTSGAAVSGTSWVVLWLEGTTSTSNTYTVTVGGVQVARQTTASLGPVSLAWNTTTFRNGNHTLSATARDSAGTTGTASVAIRVKN
jgi:hypothetical protein